MNVDELTVLKQKAARYDWLMTGGRRDYIWYHVLSPEDQDAGDVEECIDNAIVRDSMSAS